MDNQDQEINGETHESLHSSPRFTPLRLALRNFTSQWFLAPQGTGILAVILHQLPYQFKGLAIISQCIWVLTVALLVLMLATYILRAIIHPSHVRNLLRTDMMEAACLSSISIAFTTIIQMIALNLVSTWSKTWGLVAYALWWINLVMALAAVVGITYTFARIESSSIDHIPVAIRLPPIAALTASAGGGVVCRYGQLSAELQIPVIITSYLCMGLGLLLALMCDAAFLVRLFDQSWPKGQKMYSIMIACGPYGQSSFALQILGDVVKRGAFAESHHSGSLIDAASASVIGTCSVLLGLLIWGYGTFWWAFACVAILHDLVTETKLLLKWDQHLNAWSLVFPWGVYTNAAIEFGMTLPSQAFKIWSTVLAALLFVLWLFNMGASVTGSVNGKLLGLGRGRRASCTNDRSAKQS